MRGVAVLMEEQTFDYVIVGAEINRSFALR
jgi:hypothetical protein